MKRIVKFKVFIAFYLAIFFCVNICSAEEMILQLKESYYFNTLQTTDGFLLAGREHVSEENAQATAIRYYMNGDINWKENYGGTYTTIQYAAIIDEKHVAYVIQTYSMDNQTLWIADLQTGSLLFQLPLPENLMTIQQSNKGSFLIQSQMVHQNNKKATVLLLKKMDAKGSTIAEVQYPDIAPNGRYVPLEEGGYWVGYCYVDTNAKEKSPCILYINDALEIQWCQVLENDNMTVSSVCSVKDSQLLLGGHIHLDDCQHGFLQRYTRDGKCIEEIIEKSPSTCRAVYTMSDGWGVVWQYDDGERVLIGYDCSGKEVIRYNLNYSHTDYADINRLTSGNMIRIGTQDYLVFTSKDTLYILPLTNE